MKTWLTGFAAFVLLLAASAHGANLIPNSSFECGTENWIVYGSEAGAKYGNDTSVSGRLTATNRVHGSNSLMWRTRLFMQPIWLLAGNYTLSGSLMANSSTTVSNTICAEYLDYVQMTTNGASNPGILVGTSWSRFTNFLTIGSNGFFSMKFYVQSTVPMQWVDALQLETGTVASAYSPMATVEVGLATTNINHILNASSPNHIQLKAWNDGSTVGMTTVVQVVDYENTNILAATAISTNALAAGPTTINVALPAKVGWMRATSYQPTVDRSWSELVFFVRPYSASTARDTNGLFGAHPNAGEYGVQRDREAGYTWSRDLSPSAIVRWSTVQPDGTGAFVWGAPGYADTYMNLFTTNGTVPLLVLTPGLDAVWPMHATNGNPPQADLGAWSNYCFQVASRYSPAPTNAWHYEIGNEPHNILTPTDFSIASNRARLLVMGSGAVKAACPNCTVVGIAGENIASSAWETWTNMTVPERAMVDVVSAHLYPIGQGNDNPNSIDEDDLSVSRKAILWAQAGFGKPLWNTEMGNQGAKGGMLGYLGLSSPLYPTYQPLTPEAGRDFGMGQRKVVTVAREARQALRCWGVGFTKVFSYTSAQITDDIWGGDSYAASSMEFSGAPRQGAAAALIAANYFCRHPGLGRLTNINSAVIEAYYFTNVLGTVATLWCSDNAERTLTFTNGDFAIYEVMGNQIATNSTSLRLGRMPHYLVSGSLSTAQLRATVTNAAVASYTDVTGPNISVDATPVGVVTNGTHFFKWTLTDKNKQAWSIGSYSPDNTNNRSRVKFFDADTWRDAGESNHFFYPLTVTRQYSLIVEGKDFYNNITTVTGAAFGMLEGGGLTNVTLNVGTLNVGVITIISP